MKFFKLHFVNYILFAWVTFALCIFQSSFFLGAFKYISPPLIWIPPMVFLNIYKPALPALIMTYIISVIVLSFSYTYFLGGLLVVHTTIYGLNLYINKIVLGSKLWFFVFLSGFSSLVFHFLYPFCFLIFKSKNIFYFNFFHLITQTLITMFFSFILFYFFCFINSLTKVDSSKVGYP